jgi:acyl-CoA synthetase (NDP forming)
MEDGNVDAVVVVMGAIDWMPGREVPELFRDIRQQFAHKPLLAVSPLGDRRLYTKMCRGFQSLGIPSYTSDEGAIAALAALCRYRDIRRNA